MVSSGMSITKHFQTEYTYLMLMDLTAYINVSIFHHFPNSVLPSFFLSPSLCKQIRITDVHAQLTSTVCEWNSINFWIEMLCIHGNYAQYIDDDAFFLPPTHFTPNLFHLSRSVSRMTVEWRKFCLYYHIFGEMERCINSHNQDHLSSFVTLVENVSQNA